MGVLDKSQRLKKRLGLLSVYAIATGTTLSSGLFLLPGLAAASAGPAVIVSYLLASIPLIPAMLSVVELATATPRAGGAYYFLDRSMGPAVGTIGGIGTWLALVLKTAFALLGMGAYLSMFMPSVPVIYVAVGLAVAFGCLNLVGAKASGSLQIVLVAGVVVCLLWFVVAGTPTVDSSRFNDFWGKGADGVFKTAAMVYVSYVGVTKVASVSEEVRDPERVLPLGVFLAVGTAIVIYATGIVVIVGVVPREQLANSLTPVADAAGRFAGRTGALVVTIAAVLAFSSVANAGILSASRYPLAMSRDHLLPRPVGRLGRDGIPRRAVLVTLGFVVACLLLFDPARIAKLASAFQLLMFVGVCMAVVLMRESGIASYDPSFRSPWYPYTQIAGILTSLFLLAQMGWQSQLFTFGLVSFCLLWYSWYARRRVARPGAVAHVFARWGEERSPQLDVELRSILKEKGMRAHDPFEEIVARARVIDCPERCSFEGVTRQAAEELARVLPEPPERIQAWFLEGTRVGATPVSRGVALPHCRHGALERPHMVLVRVHQGLQIPPSELGVSLHDPEEFIYALVYLASPEHDPTQHLRLLAQVARCAEDDGFLEAWLGAKDTHALRLLLLREERMLELAVVPTGPHASWIGRAVRDVALPAGALIAIVRRGGKSRVPRGSTVLRADDRLTLIGEPDALASVREGTGSGAGDAHTRSR